MHKIKTRLESKRGRRNDRQTIGVVIMIIGLNLEYCSMRLSGDG